MFTLSMRKLRTVVLVAAVTLPSSAMAEPVRLTGGYLEVLIPVGLARGQFEGDNFSVTLHAEGFRTWVAVDCYPCTSGTTVNLDGRFTMDRAGGSGTIDGVTYPQVYLDGMSGTFTTASIELTGTESIEVALPFSYAGIVSGYLIDPWVYGPQDAVFTKTLAGQGTARATFFNAGGLFTPIDMRYDFEGAAPVPEPGSMLLFGSGAAWIAARWRKRSKPQS